jgi:TIGR03009 family protein
LEQEKAMRIFCLVLTGFLSCVAVSLAQQPAAQLQPAQPLAPAGQVKSIDQHLATWETRMKEISSLEMNPIERVDKDVTFKMVNQWQGAAMYSKPNLASLWLKRKDKQELWEKWICSGAAIYQYVPTEKKIVIHQMPAKKDGAVSDENFLGFMFGMKAEDAKKRYDLQISKDKDGKSKENDPYYVYIDIKPREERDKADFEMARLVLHKDSYLPRQLWFRHPNGDETTWNILQAKSGVAIPRKEFMAPEAPKGWSMVQGMKPSEAKANDPKSQPRIVRPQGQ